MPNSRSPRGALDRRETIVCPRCDGIFAIPRLQPAEHATCPDCGEVLLRYHAVSHHFVLAAAVTGAILLLIALLCPVLSASLGGLRTEVNLFSAPAAFAGDGFGLLAGILVFISIAVPAIQVGFLAWLLSFAARRRRAPGFKWLLPALHAVRRWAMVEVVLLGSLIVIVKVGGWVSIILGPGLWSLAAFTCLLIGLHRFDSAALWDWDLR